MRIVLINENSQASKNSLIFTTLQNVAEKYGHTVKNYGMFGADDKSLTYVQNGLLAAILLNAEACDFVVTGCGTGEGAMLALNSFPKVLCGHIVDPSDAYMFNQINDGNAVAFPFAKGFGWGAELNLEYCFEKLFNGPKGQGYPRERAIPEQTNKKILDQDCYMVLIKIKQEKYQSRIKDIVESHEGLKLRFWSGKYLEVSEIYFDGVTKGRGVSILGDYFSIPYERRICFGDALNDLEMFKRCKYSFCMKNGEEELKSISYKVTQEDNNHDGIYLELKDFDFDR